MYCEKGISKRALVAKFSSHRQQDKNFDILAICLGNAVRYEN